MRTPTDPRSFLRRSALALGVRGLLVAVLALVALLTSSLRAPVYAPRPVLARTHLVDRFDERREAVAADRAAPVRAARSSTSAAP